MYLYLGLPVTLSCPDGFISELSNAGFIPSSYDRKDYCGANIYQPLVKSCNTYFNQAKFEGDFAARCTGKETCSAPLILLDYI